MSYAHPPCACCAQPVSISGYKKEHGGKKIERVDCCGAAVCPSPRCGTGGSCIFCKKSIPSTSVVRKTSYPNWEETFLEFWRLESLSKQPFFFEFLRYSKCSLNYRLSFSIQHRLRQYIDSQVMPSLFRQVIQFRVRTPRSFPFRTSDEIEIYQKMKICQKMYSIVNSSDFVRIYQQHLKKSAIVMRYSRKFCQFGCILFIALKLSTLKLKTMLLPDVNAIRRIISRFTKNKAR